MFKQQRKANGKQFKQIMSIQQRKPNGKQLDNLCLNNKEKLPASNLNK